MKRTFRAFLNGTEVGKTTTARADRAYVAAVVLTYPNDVAYGKFAGVVKVSNWSSDSARVLSIVAENQTHLVPRGFKVAVTTDIRLDAPRASKVGA